MIRRARPFAGAAAAAALAVAAALTGCGLDPAGIQGTSVVEAGPPATIATIPERGAIVVFFVGPRGRLTPVVKPGPFGDESETPDTAPSAGVDLGADGGAGSGAYRLPLGYVLHLLFRGPSQADRAAGLRTALPADAMSGPVEAKYGDDQVRLVLGFPVTTLTETARQQVLCTLSRSDPKLSSLPVVMAGPDGATEPAVCRAPAV